MNTFLSRLRRTSFFKFSFFVFLFISILFSNKTIFLIPGQAPGMGDTMSDFPDADDPGLPQDIDVEPLPIAQEVLLPGTGIPEKQPAPEIPQESAPVIPADLASPPVGITSPAPGTPATIAPPPAVPQAMPATPMPAAPVGPTVEESQFPLIEPEQGKMVDVTEKSGPLIKAQKIEELQKILDEAEVVIQKINGAFVAIENVAAEIESKFKSTDEQLDLLYQTVGFDRGVTAQELAG